MQRSLTQMAVKVKEEMDELHRQRVAAHAQAQAQAHAQAQLRAQQEAAYAAQVQAQQRAAFAAANAQRQHFAEQLKRQQVTKMPFLFLIEGNYLAGLELGKVN